MKTKIKSREILLRVSRLMSGMSQCALAKKIGVSQPAISELETDGKGVGLAKRRKIAEILDVDFFLIWPSLRPEQKERSDAK